VPGVHSAPPELPELDVLVLVELELLEVTVVELTELEPPAPPDPPAAALPELELVALELPVVVSCPVLPCVALLPDDPHATHAVEATVASAGRIHLRPRRGGVVMQTER
jgi:hypothetical protein